MEPIFCQSCKLLRHSGKKRFLSISYQTLSPMGNFKLRYLSISQKAFIPTLFNAYTRKYGKFYWFRSLYISNLTNSKISNYWGEKQSKAYTSLRTCKTLAVGKTTYVTQSEFEDTFNNASLPFKKGYTGYLTTCSSCHYNNESSLFVDMRTGDSVCGNCGVNYDWETLKKTVKKEVKSVDLKNYEVEEVEESSPLSHQLWVTSHLITEEAKQKVDKLTCIPLDLLHRYDIRCTDDSSKVLFPYYDITRKTIIGFKSLDITLNDSSPRPTFFKDKSLVSLFGWNLVNSDDTVLVLTANELDAVAITSATGITSLSLANGASSLPPACLPFLEQFSKIIFWFGHDNIEARDNSRRFASKLSLSRCLQVTLQQGAANALNTKGAEYVESCLRMCTSMSHDQIVSYKELRNQVLSNLVKSNETRGITYKRFPLLNEFLKGHRRGEFTVVTGPTGSGKTTLLSEMTLDLCEQGVKTLWGSFEITNFRLVNTMLHQFSGYCLEKHLDKFAHWSDEFENLPMYFMNYHGSQDLKQVINTIEYAIYAYDIEHVIIDNLQFMLTKGTGERQDRFQVMDNHIAAFRKCATEHNIHVTIVIHPKKVGDDAPLTTLSIFGSAKSTQEADNVLILQDRDGKCMELSKNRFSGHVGQIPLLFNSSSMCLSGFHRTEDGQVILPQLKPNSPIRHLNVGKSKKK